MYEVVYPAKQTKSDVVNTPDECGKVNSLLYSNLYTVFSKDKNKKKLDNS